MRVRRATSRAVRLLTLAAAMALAAGCATAGPMPGPTDAGPVPTGSAPRVTRTVVARGLDHPWDLAFLPGGDALVTERSGRISRLHDGRVTPLLEVADTVSRAEAGLMGLAVDPEFERTRFVFACLASSRDGGDVRVARWRLADDELTDRRDVLTGIPLNPAGFHNGCRLAVSGAGPDTALWVSTGDAFRGTAPQSRTALAGKILRVDRDGRARPDNPEGPDRRVFSWGHRNPQGLAPFDVPRQVAGRTVYGLSVEHGPDTDDEIDWLTPGNFGWAPDRGGGYDQSVPMTDTARFPDAVPALWSSGRPTVAPSGGTLITGDAWGDWAGTLAVAQLKGERLAVLGFAGEDRLVQRAVLLDHTDGRLRQVVQGPDGTLWVTTDNGGDDRILRLTPGT